MTLFITKSDTCNPKQKNRLFLNYYLGIKLCDTLHLLRVFWLWFRRVLTFVVVVDVSVLVSCFIYLCVCVLSTFFLSVRFFRHFGYFSGRDHKVYRGVDM